MKYLMLISLMCLNFFSFSQSAGPDAELLVRAQACAEEVYPECPQYIAANYIAKYAKRLARVEIRTQPITSGEPYRLLSSAGLVNKCNPGLERDNATTFNPEKFNPLKYFLQFSSSEDVVYRVDNTVYLIIIHPAK